ncbi:M23 family metallopeptidase [Gulosibacter macacae]|uniref:M23 family metallopeptidase n=1 Tax=Gulosibacter macacae TaxID=2488791 RepID=A0A3P3VZF5_9MICO|nr:M23 family metallopeptidase [Gulosibacter macacae]RRJ88175.1 M23 family metallopeptidase [Gulosibacter macacae]
MPATRSTTTRTRRNGLRAISAAVLTFILVGSGLNAAVAKDLDDYATWDDVIAAQGDIDRQNALIDEINVQIDDLNNQVTIAEGNALAAGDIYSAAQDAATAQAGLHYTLDQQAQDAATTAEAAERDAGAMAAAMSNRVSNDPTMQLLTQPEQADDFLMSMSTLSKLGTYNGAVYEDAVTARNNADSLADQAQVALDERIRLEDEAESAYNAAVIAQANVQTARDNAVTQGSELEAMLIPLKEHRDVVEADYHEGERLREEERKRIEEQRRREQEERERIAAEEAAAAQAAAEAAGIPYVPPAPSSGDGGAGYSGGISPPMSWNSVVTSPYGMRWHPTRGGYSTHWGLDLVVPGGSCWAPLYAIDSGTITYAGEMGTYGNMVDINSNGTTFRYAHMSYGGINVWPGQYVNAGDVIGYAGTTGASTGCHLHLEIMPWGNNVDPQVWLADRGIYYW